MANIRVGRRSGRVFRGGRSRRESQWLFWDTSETTLAGAPTAVLTNSLNAIALAFRPFTVVRARLFLQIRSDIATGGETFGVSMGFCVVSDQAVAIGVTAVPTPVTDKGSDLWFVYESLIGSFETSTPPPPAATLPPNAT